MKSLIPLLSAAFAGAFAFASCNRSPEAPSVAGPANSESSPASTTAWITASPNPIPGATGQGTTLIKWHTGEGSGAVYLGNSDFLFAYGPDGSQEASWIDLTSSTEFVLFKDVDRKIVLGRVTVKGSK